MSGFNTKEKNNYGEYEIAFYTDNHEDFKKVQDLCRELIDHDKPVSTEGDLISREALKKALKSNCTPEICHDYGTNWCEACCPHNDFEDLIDNAPTVQPEMPKGEWIKEDNGKTTDLYRCSICGRSIMLCKNADLSKYPFCHCGAKMKGGAE